MKKALTIFLSVLMIFAVACAQQPEPVAQAPPEPSKPVQTQPTPAQPAPQPAPAVEEKPSEPSKPVQTAKTVQVAIRSFKFTPADVTVNVGDTIVWTNDDSAPHTVESSDGTLRSDELSKGDTYSYQFTKAGKYNYVCGIHPGMKGSVTVQ